ncbi:hypothetical protein L6164_035726 [Bauhinia variegata]|uniref:Uncharacterized protein n=1 Tax=Bauhinia variegata TaxID=167791 RepID=A0ACB9KEW7_BAUVA|nr:hypothetical protein L6164_035726 [Bauhinia variegata]
MAPQMKTPGSIERQFCQTQLLSLYKGQGTIIHAVDYSFENRVATSPGGITFNNQIGADYARSTMEAATNFIWNLFQQNTDADRKNVQRVSLIIVQNFNNPNVPAGTGGDQIYFSADYIQQTGGDKTEFTGVLYHEMTHVWQWDGNGQSEIGWVIEGIADFFRLKADYAPGHWVKPGDGANWKERSDVTALFLEYCDGLKTGFVAELNKKMRDSYSDDYFVQLLGKTVDQLWSDYKAKYSAAN